MTAVASASVVPGRAAATRRPVAALARRALVAGWPVIGTLVAWELVGRLGVVGDGALPAPTSIAAQWWRDRAAYPAHVRTTVGNAAIGYLVGNVVALALSAAFLLVPLVERLLRSLLVVAFCLPPVVVAPVLAVSFPAPRPNQILAGLAVVYPTLVATLVGLRGADPTACRVVRAAGGGRLAELREVRIPGAVPNALVGLQIAAPAALLGSLLGEFLGGRTGLGVYLLGSLGRGNPSRVWGIGLTATALSAAAFALLGLAARTSSRRAVDPTIGAEAPVDAFPSAGRTWWQRGIGAVVSIVVALGAWQLLIVAFDLSPTFARGPRETWQYLFDMPASAANRQAIVDAASSTVPVALAGLACGLLLAVVMGALTTLVPGLARGLLPVSLVLQSMPLVAMTPVVVLVLGRGTVAMLAICASVTFFPAFVVVADGLSSTSPAALDLMRVLDAGRWTTLWRVSLPSALPHLLAAASLAAPRCLLGVMIAEYLAVGGGLGFLLAESRGKLAFGAMWAIAATTAVLSIAVYKAVALLEVLAARRFGSGTVR